MKSLSKKIVLLSTLTVLFFICAMLGFVSLSKSNNVTYADTTELENEFTNNGQFTATKYDGGGICGNIQFVDSTGLPTGCSGAVLKLISNGYGAGALFDFSNAHILASDVESITVRIYSPNYSATDDEFRTYNGSAWVQYGFGAIDMSNWTDITLNASSMSEIAKTGENGELGNTWIGIRTKSGSRDYYIDSVTINYSSSYYEKKEFTNNGQFTFTKYDVGGICGNIQFVDSTGLPTGCSGGVLKLISNGYGAGALFDFSNAHIMASDVESITVRIYSPNYSATDDEFRTYNGSAWVLYGFGAIDMSNWTDITLNASSMNEIAKTGVNGELGNTWIGIRTRGGSRDYYIDSVTINYSSSYYEKEFTNNGQFLVLNQDKDNTGNRVGGTEKPTLTYVDAELEGLSGATGAVLKVSKVNNFSYFTIDATDSHIKASDVGSVIIRVYIKDGSSSDTFKTNAFDVNYGNNNIHSGFVDITLNSSSMEKWTLENGELGKTLIFAEIKSTAEYMYIDSITINYSDSYYQRQLINIEQVTINASDVTNSGACVGGTEKPTLTYVDAELEGLSGATGTVLKVSKVNGFSYFQVDATASQIKASDVESVVIRAYIKGGSSSDTFRTNAWQTGNNSSYGNCNIHTGFVEITLDSASMTSWTLQDGTLGKIVLFAEIKSSAEYMYIDSITINIKEPISVYTLGDILNGRNNTSGWGKIHLGLNTNAPILTSGEAYATAQTGFTLNGKTLDTSKIFFHFDNGATWFIFLYETTDVVAGTNGYSHATIEIAQGATVTYGGNTYEFNAKTFYLDNGAWTTTKPSEYTITYTLGEVYDGRNNTSGWGYQHLALSTDAPILSSGEAYPTAQTGFTLNGNNLSTSQIFFWYDNSSTRFIFFYETEDVLAGANGYSHATIEIAQGATVTYGGNTYEFNAKTFYLDNGAWTTTEPTGYRVVDASALENEFTNNGQFLVLNQDKDNTGNRVGGTKPTLSYVDATTEGLSGATGAVLKVSKVSNYSYFTIDATDSHIKASDVGSVIIRVYIKDGSSSDTFKTNAFDVNYGNKNIHSGFVDITLNSSSMEKWTLENGELGKTLIFAEIQSTAEYMYIDSITINMVPSTFTLGEVYDGRNNTSGWGHQHLALSTDAPILSSGEAYPTAQTGFTLNGNNLSTSQIFFWYDNSSTRFIFFYETGDVVAGTNGYSHATIEIAQGATVTYGGNTYEFNAKTFYLDNGAWTTTEPTGYRVVDASALENEFTNNGQFEINANGITNVGECVGGTKPTLTYVDAELEGLTGATGAVLKVSKVGYSYFQVDATASQIKANKVESVVIRAYIKGGSSNDTFRTNAWQDGNSYYGNRNIHTGFVEITLDSASMTSWTLEDGTLGKIVLFAEIKSSAEYMYIDSITINIAEKVTYSSLYKDNADWGDKGQKALGLYTNVTFTDGQKHPLICSGMTYNGVPFAWNEIVLFEKRIVFLYNPTVLTAGYNGYSHPTITIEDGATAVYNGDTFTFSAVTYYLDNGAWTTTEPIGYNGNNLFISYDSQEYKMPIGKGITVDADYIASVLLEKLGVRLTVVSWKEDEVSKNYGDCDLVKTSLTISVIEAYEFFTEDGASVRIANDGNSGLRFETKIKEESYNALKSAHGTYSFGTLMAPLSLLNKYLNENPNKNYYDYFIENAKGSGDSAYFMDIPTKGLVGDITANTLDGYIRFFGSQVGISDVNYFTKFVGVGYVKLGDKLVLANNSIFSNSRTMYQVAVSAYNDTATDYTIEQLNLIKTYIDPVVELTYNYGNLEIVNPITNRSYDSSYIVNKVDTNFTISGAKSAVVVVDGKKVKTSDYQRVDTLVTVSEDVVKSLFIDGVLYGIAEPNVNLWNSQVQYATGDMLAEVSGALGSQAFRVWINDAAVVSNSDEAFLIDSKMDELETFINKLIKAGVKEIYIQPPQFLQPNDMEVYFVQENKTENYKWVDYNNRYNNCVVIAHPNIVPDPETESDMYSRWLGVIYSYYDKLTAKVASWKAQYGWSDNVSFYFEGYNEPGLQGTGSMCFKGDYTTKDGGKSWTFTPSKLITKEVMAMILTDMAYYQTLAVKKNFPEARVTTSGMSGRIHTDVMFNDGRQTSADNLFEEMANAILDNVAPTATPFITPDNTTNPDDYFTCLNWHPYMSWFSNQNSNMYYMDNKTNGNLNADYVQDWINLNNGIYDAFVNVIKAKIPNYEIKVVFTEFGLTDYGTHKVGAGLQANGITDQTCSDVIMSIMEAVKYLKFASNCTMIAYRLCDSEGIVTYDISAAEGNIGFINEDGTVKVQLKDYYNLINGNNDTTHLEAVVSKFYH